MTTWYSVGAALLLLLSRFSRVRLCETPWTAAYQAPLSMGFSRQEYWSGVPLNIPTPTFAAVCWPDEPPRCLAQGWGPGAQSPGLLHMGLASSSNLLQLVCEALDRQGSHLSRLERTFHLSLKHCSVR